MLVGDYRVNHCENETEILTGRQNDEKIWFERQINLSQQIDNFCSGMHGI